MTGGVLNDVGEGAPGRGQLRGTDLERSHNLQGDNLVLRVNKAGVLVFPGNAAGRRAADAGKQAGALQQLRARLRVHHR